jgi:hypothetical protein
MRVNPLLKCGNKTEFMQRLQWLSEGMLRNHLEHVIDYKPNEVEIQQYEAYRRLHPK